MLRKHNNEKSVFLKEAAKTLPWRTKLQNHSESPREKTQEKCTFQSLNANMEDSIEIKLFVK